MSGRIVRTITKAKDVTKLADHVTSDNDIISDIDGNIYLKQGSKNYVQLALSKDTESLQSEITSLKSENTKLKNRVTDLETANSEQATKISDLETTNSEQATKISDLITRVEALEEPEPINVTGVKLDKTTLSLEVGATATLNATISPENASYKAVSFTSSDDTIATVDDKGLVTAVKAGTADITVVSLMDGSKKDKCTLTVTEPPTEEQPPADNGDTTTE